MYQEVPCVSVQLALNVDDLDAAIRFYSTLFATEPAKVRPATRTSRLPSRAQAGAHPGFGAGGTLNHLGIEVESTAEVGAAQARLAGSGLTTATEDQVACCYALQDKVWVDGPSGEPWEIYTVLEHVEMPGGQLRNCRSRDRRGVLRRGRGRCRRRRNACC